MNKVKNFSPMFPTALLPTCKAREGSKFMGYLGGPDQGAMVFIEKKGRETFRQGGRKPRSAGAPLLRSEQSRTKCEPISKKFSGPTFRTSFLG